LAKPPAPARRRGRVSWSTGSRPLAWTRRPKSPRPAVFRDMPDRSRSGVSPGTRKCPCSVVDPGDGSPRASPDRAARSTAHRSGLPERSAARHFQPGRCGPRFAAWCCDAATGAGTARAPASEPGRRSIAKHSCKDSGTAAVVPQPRTCGLPYVRQRTDGLRANLHKEGLTGQTTASGAGESCCAQDPRWTPAHPPARHYLDAIDRTVAELAPIGRSETQVVHKPDEIAARAP
jgi:hypothetical protein